MFILGSKIKRLNNCRQRLVFVWSVKVWIRFIFSLTGKKGNLIVYDRAVIVERTDNNRRTKLKVAGTINEQRSKKNEPINMILLSINGYIIIILVYIEELVVIQKTPFK